MDEINESLGELVPGRVVVLGRLTGLCGGSI